MRTNVPISGDALAAMRILVQAGVSDEAIGRAMRDLLMADEPDTLAPVPFSPLIEEQLPGGPATGTPAVVQEAAPPPPASPRFTTSSSPIVGTVPLKVRFSDGKPSNVTIPAQLMYDVGLRLGSDDAARQKVRDLARAVPETVSNRSGWIQAELAALVSAP